MCTINVCFAGRRQTRCALGFDPPARRQRLHLHRVRASRRPRSRRLRYATLCLPCSPTPRRPLQPSSGARGSFTSPPSARDVWT